MKALKAALRDNTRIPTDTWLGQFWVLIVTGFAIGYGIKTDNEIVGILGMIVALLCFMALTLLRQHDIAAEKRQSHRDEINGDAS